MTLNVELKISSLLSMNLSPRGISERLSQEILSPQYTPGEQDLLLKALVQMGFYKKALSLIIDRIDDSQHFPWKPFLFLLWKLEVSPSKEYLDAILTGAKEQGQMEELGSFRPWETWDPRFKDLRLSLENKARTKHQETLKKLQDKFNLLRSQKLHEEAAKVLTQLKLLSPQDKTIQEELKNIKNIWSKDIISIASFQRNRQLPLSISQKKEQKRLQKQARELFQFVKEQEISDEKKLYNLALLFKFIEAPALSLKLLEGIHNLSADWMRIEAYLDDQQYFMVLEELSQMEETYSQDPDTCFAVAYTKAIAFKNLDQTSAAITLMEKVVRVKPQYRSAQLYLKKWKF